MYHVAFTDVSGAPLEIRAELRMRMQQIATTVDSIPRDHSFWSKAAEHELQVDVRGWRFFYRVDQATYTLDVLRATQLTIVSPDRKT
jgi:hypothetical protein